MGRLTRFFQDSCTNPAAFVLVLDRCRMAAFHRAALLFLAIGVADVVKAQCTCDFCPYGYNVATRCGADTSGCSLYCPNCGTCDTWSCESVPT